MIDVSLHQITDVLQPVYVSFAVKCSTRVCEQCPLRGMFRMEYMSVRQDARTRRDVASRRIVSRERM